MTGVDDAGFFYCEQPNRFSVFYFCSVFCKKHMHIFLFPKTDRLFFNVIFIKIIIFGQN